MIFKTLLITLSVAVHLEVGGWAASCPDCEVSDAKKAQYNALLNLTSNQKKKAESHHVPFGLPVSAAAASHEHLLDQKDYLTWYDDDLRVPLWVAYRLTKDDVSAVRERLDCFRRDPRLSDDAAAECADYLEPTFDQGHLAPNGDFKREESAMINTYIYSNITPQQKNFNEHTWERLESLVRMWAKKRGDLYVITGAVFDIDGDNTRDADSQARRVAPRNRVAIPTHFYKIIIKKHTFGAPEAIAIMLPHDNDKHTGAAWISYVTEHITTIGEIERVTGVDFLVKLSASKRAALKNFKAPALWPKE